MYVGSNPEAMTPGTALAAVITDTTLDWLVAERDRIRAGGPLTSGCWSGLEVRCDKTGVSSFVCHGAFGGLMK